MKYVEALFGVTEHRRPNTEECKIIFADFSGLKENAFLLSSDLELNRIMHLNDQRVQVRNLKNFSFSEMQVMKYVEALFGVTEHRGMQNHLRGFLGPEGESFSAQFRLGAEY